MAPKKVYGQYQQPTCPFCGKLAIQRNSQGLSVCKEHKDEQLKSMKCTCGSWLDLREGKYGPFFVCVNCGCISMRKALEMKKILTD
jgi:predicted RNA-binding Zn-ribbon protein involved in translation (DUF1610 family)